MLYILSCLHYSVAQPVARTMGGLGMGHQFLVSCPTKGESVEKVL